MFLDLSGVHATRWCSTVYPKNILGPIAASTSDLEALNPPEKCSWSYLAIALHNHQLCQPEKCSWTYSGIASHVFHTRCKPEKCCQTYRGFHVKPVNLKNILGAIRNCLGLLQAWDIAERATDPTSHESSAWSQSHLKTSEFRQDIKWIHPQRQSFRD
jgi:hypothetical protein